MAQQTRRSTHSSKKAPSTIHKPLLLAAGAVIFLAGGYLLRSTYYNNHFLPNTVVNGITISGLTVSEADKKLKSKLSDAPFLIKLDHDPWKSIQRKDLDWNSRYQDELTALKNKQNPLSWGMQLVSAASKKNVGAIALNQGKLDALLNQIKAELTQLNTTREPTTNATVKHTDNGFKIVPEKQGTTVDIDAAATAIANAIKNGKTSIHLNDYLAKPILKKDDPKLKKALDEMDAIAKVKATYSINGKKVQIPTETVNDWLIDNTNGVSLDQEKVTAYLQALGEKYNTSTNPTQFKSTLRGNVSVPAGTYSWSIDTKKETKALTEQILKGKNFTRSPIVSGSTTADKPLISDTYIEVDLQNQHMWYYNDGKVSLETDIVSGKPNTPTPPGVNYVWNKERNAVLRGFNDDGSKYASPVSYWMPIDWTGVGIHDSDWQPEYGGSLWLSVGSHGCVNTPPAIMSQLYNIVETGTPVLVF